MVVLEIDRFLNLYKWNEHIKNYIFKWLVYFTNIFKFFWEANILKVQYTVIHVTYFIFQLN